MANNSDSELLEASRRLLSFADEYAAAPASSAVNDLWQRAKDLGKSSSGSWLGYQANVYYKDFQVPPAGEHFDIQHGTGGTIYSRSDPNWIEHASEAVFDLLVDPTSKEALAEAETLSEKGLALLADIKADVSSFLTVHLRAHDDAFVRRLADEIAADKVATAGDIANSLAPNRTYISSDMQALQQGTWAPPHVKVQARVQAANQPAAHCRELAKKIEKLAAHLERAKRAEVRAARIGTNIFIGHGRSKVWRDLKDFVQDRLRLPYDEFNRVPVAGITNIARLSEMLDSAAWAFVIMTAEDEQVDGKLQARMNVIHEVGLFQGRLGFTKAIVLLEEGCEEFSNIQGLGQIRFPKGNIAAKFEEIRQVLERENVLEP
mgnify:FL=1